jgi:glycosyltransferase involved in cell wall biosynthesis
MKMSIAIPVYECHGKGWLYLSELLNSIAKQSEKDLEIVISDQSTDDNIEKLCSSYSNFMNIKLVDGRHVKRSNSPNANNAISNCSSDIIKVIFQDDFFIDDDACKKTLDAFSDSNVGWIVSGCAHCNSIHSLFRPFIPRYNHDIHIGNNTISSPSVLAFRGKTLFDENLIMLMDCDIYKNLYIKYGDPYIITDYLICNRLHENQLQNTSKDVLDSEILYCKEKYKNA